MKTPLGQNEVLDRVREKVKRSVLARASATPTRRAQLSFASEIAAARELERDGRGKVERVDGETWFVVGDED